MSNVPVPEDGLITGLIAVVAGAFGWLYRLERRPRGLTREEHDEICSKNQTALRQDLSEIKSILRNQDERALNYREATSRDITDIKVKLASTLSAYDAK